MKDKRTILFSDYTVPPPDATRKESDIRQALHAARRIPRESGFLAQLKTQLGYIGPWFWIGLGVLILILLGVHWWIGTQTLIEQNRMLPTLALFSGAGPLVAALAAPVLARSYTYDMWELEEASYHNLSRLTTLRIGICALAVLPVMAVLAAAGLGLTGLLPGVACLAAPFLLASGMNYFILGRLRGTAGSLCCVGACLVLALFCALPLLASQLIPSLTRSGLLPVAAVGVLLVCAAVFLLGARSFAHKNPAES